MSPNPTGEFPLAGLRVADFTHFWAGPIVGNYLAYLGADVVKIEGPNRPDPLRFAQSVTSFPNAADLGPLFLSMNLGKRGLAIDLAREDGLRIARQLVANSDVILENFSPGVMEAWGLSVKAIRELAPEASIVRMPAYGLEGEWKQRPGYAMSVDAISGMAGMSGFVGEEPLLTGSIGDPFGGFHSIAAVLASIFKKSASGRGHAFEVSLVDVTAQLVTGDLFAFADSGIEPARMGNRNATGSLQDIFRCSDGWLAVSVATDVQFGALADEVLGSGQASSSGTGIPEVSDVESALRQWCSVRSQTDAWRLLVGLGVPAAPTTTGPELSEHSVLRSRKRFFTIDHPVVGEVEYTLWPMKSNLDPEAPYSRPAPRIGEHTHDILAELGYSEAEIEGLSAAGVISVPTSVPQEG